MNKPKALVLSTTTLNQNSYFNAGISHFYETDIFYVTPRRSLIKSFLTRTPPDLYLWQYSKDVKFIECFDKDIFLNIPEGKYDTIFIIASPFFQIFEQDRNKAMEVLKNLRKKTKKLYWVEPGEVLFFSFGREEFWNLVDGVIKSFLFKKEFAYKMREDSFASDYHILSMPDHFKYWIEENKKMHIEDWYHKIIPMPLPPSITDRPATRWVGRKRIYNIAGNFQGNAGLRFAVERLLENKLPDEVKYSFDYGKDGYKTNYKNFKNIFSPFLIRKFNVGRVLFQLIYGKYFYPKPYYFHNLANSEVYLGLGHYVNSLRTADSWGSGTALINWNMDMFDYGFPLVDGYNYFSLGNREDITTDNTHLKPEYEQKILDKVNVILADKEKIATVVDNGLEFFKEYFSSPKQYIKKFFIEKIK